MGKETRCPVCHRATMVEAMTYSALLGQFVCPTCKANAIAQTKMPAVSHPPDTASVTQKRSHLALFAGLTVLAALITTTAIYFCRATLTPRVRRRLWLRAAEFTTDNQDGRNPVGLDRRCDGANPPRSAQTPDGHRRNLAHHQRQWRHPRRPRRSIVARCVNRTIQSSAAASVNSKSRIPQFRPPRDRPPYMHRLSSPTTRGPVTDEQIGNAIQHGVDYLLAHFKDGEIEHTDGVNEPLRRGIDALCVYALATSSKAIVDPRISAKSPEMIQMIEAAQGLRLHIRPRARRPAHVFPVACACMLATFNRPQDRAVLEDDVAWLIHDASAGGYTYDDRFAPPYVPRKAVRGRSPTSASSASPRRVWERVTSKSDLRGCQRPVAAPSHDIRRRRHTAGRSDRARADFHQSTWQTQTRTGTR